MSSPLPRLALMLSLGSAMAGLGACGSERGRSTDASLPPEPAVPGVNALLLDGRILPLYRTASGGAAAPLVGFDSSAAGLTARDATGRELWRLASGPQIHLTQGTFDFNADGWPDLALSRVEATGEICGTTPRRRSWLELLDGRTGLATTATEPTPDICWEYPGTTYPTLQWAEATVITGPDSPLVSLQPYYATSGRIVAVSGGRVETRSEYVFPSTAAFNVAYPGSEPHYTYSHVALGFVLGTAVQPRLVFYTSGRVVGFDVSVPAARLAFDRTFLVGGRADLNRRHKGLVALEPGGGGLWLFAGTDARSLYCDMRKGAAVTDPWARIERHLTRFDLPSTAVQHRFYSYAYDHETADQYEGRLAFPVGALVTAGEGGAHAFYNVYERGHWQLHITQSARTEDLQTVPDAYLWDIRDIDGDGTSDFLLSRVSSAGTVGERYFPEWRTEVHGWDEASHTLRWRATLEGIPELAPAMKQASDSVMSFVGPYFPALSIARDGRSDLLLRTRSGLRAQRLDGSAGFDLAGGSPIENVCAVTAAP